MSSLLEFAPRCNIGRRSGCGAHGWVSGPTQVSERGTTGAVNRPEPWNQALLSLMGNPGDVTCGGRSVNSPGQACREVRRRPGTLGRPDVWGFRAYDVCCRMALAVGRDVARA